MAFTFRAEAGKVAIYDRASGDGPFTNPLGYMPRVKFHSDLDYIQIIKTIKSSVVLPQRSAGADGAYITSFTNGPAHGVSGMPLVFGYLTMAGGNVAFAGSVPIQNVSGGTRFISLGASPTRLIFNEVVNIYGGSSVPAIRVYYTVFITDEVLT